VLPLFRYLLQAFGTYNYEGDLLISLGIAVVVLLLIATVPTVVASMLIGILRGQRLARVTNIAIWGGFAALTLPALYIPALFDSLNTDAILFANPAVALYQILAWDAMEQVRQQIAVSQFQASPGMSMIADWLSIFGSIGVMLVVAWGALALAVLQIQRRAFPGRRVPRHAKQAIATVPASH
jgi:hypothetical protein